jgi:hypothetical protein
MAHEAQMRVECRRWQQMCGSLIRPKICRDQRFLLKFGVKTFSLSPNITVWVRYSSEHQSL